jgi:hypothetical protein
MKMLYQNVYGPALLAILAIGGCASNPSVPSYSHESEDTARLRIALSKGSVPRTAAGDGMTAFIHTQEGCSLPKVLGAVYTLDEGPGRHDPARRNHRKSGKLNMPLGEYDSLEVEELLIDASPDQSVVLQFSVLLGGPFGAFTRCGISMEQDFEAGRDYEIIGRFDTPNSCSAVINELVAGDDAVERVQIAEVDDKLNPLSPACFVKY